MPTRDSPAPPPRYRAIVAGLPLPLAATLATAAVTPAPIPAWLLAALACFLLLSWRVRSSESSSLRPVLAAAIAVGGAWSSLVWHAKPVTPPVNTDHAALANSVRYPTLVVAGWPVQGVQGNGRGHAPDRLPADRGWFAMHANLLGWFAAALLASLAVPSRILPWVARTAIGTGVLGYLVGFCQLVWMVD